MIDPELKEYLEKVMKAMEYVELLRKNDLLSERNKPIEEIERKKPVKVEFEG